MSPTTFEAVFGDLIRSVVREEIRAALAEQPPRNGAVSDVYLSITKAAKVADVAPGTIRAWIRAGRLPARRAGRVYRIGRAELEAFLAGCESAAKRMRRAA